MEKWFKEKTPAELENQIKSVRYYKDLNSPSLDDVSALRKIRKEGIKKEDLESQIHEKVDHVVEGIVKKSEMVGQGYDGMVFRIRLDSISEDERHLLEDDGIDLPDQEQALKILKVYRPLAGELEFAIQKEAYEYLKNDPESAYVPVPVALRDQEIDVETKDFLNSKGAGLADNMEAIFMDYIEGKDLDEIFYDFVLEKIGLEADYIEAMTFSQKYSEVANYLGFQLSDLSVRNDMDAIRNTDRLISFLKKEGFSINESIISQLEKAQKILMENNIFHNDLHGRNVRIDSSGKVYLLDFGRSSREKPISSNSVFLEKWRGLLKDKGEGWKEPREIVEIENLRAKLKTGKVWDSRIQTLLTTLNDKNIESKWRAISSDDLQLHKFLAELKEVVSLSDDKKLIINDFLKKESIEGTSPYIRNKLKRLLSGDYFS